MPKEWNDDEVSALIRENVEIVRGDKFEAFLRKRFTSSDDDKTNPKDAPPSSGGDNPSPGPSGSKARKSLWWGESSD